MDESGEAPTPNPRQVLGQRGEDLAATYLHERGLTVIERNWRCRDGEIDIVARDGDCLVFVEVKTRSSQGFGPPEEAVTWRKAQRLRRLASHWLREHDASARLVRIDVIAILQERSGATELTHLRDVTA